MGGGIQFLDIIFFAMVAAFLILRLRSVLGRRTGHEQQHAEGHMRRRGRIGANDAKPDAVPAGPIDIDEVEREMSRAAGPGASQDTAAGLTQIKLADPAFDPEEFLAGARSAFSMIIAAFAAGDRDTLHQLVSDDVLVDFIAAINAREAAGETMEHRLVSLSAARIASAEMRGRTAFVEVEFVSEQLNVVRDAEGEVVDGDPDQPDEVVDLWTFCRDTDGEDPTWTLVVTESD
jgi:predicted lipid-binding transport protein (Tim44 family)